MNLTYSENSNNFGGSYIEEDPFISDVLADLDGDGVYEDIPIDRNYRFEGYQVFQLKDEQCSKFPEYKNLKIKEKEPVEPIDLTKGDDCILTLLLMGFGVALVIIFSP